LGKGKGKDERHAVPMSTDRWYVLGGKQEVRYTGEVRFCVITISTTSGEVET
jgi:hypothetical protein